MVRDGIQTTSIMAADPFNCACGCDLAHLAWAIPNRTGDRLFLAEADRAGAGKRDHRERQDRIDCFVAGVDVSLLAKRLRTADIS